MTMSNGQRCCILQICCPPPPMAPSIASGPAPSRNPKAEAALAEVLEGWLKELPDNSDIDVEARYLARQIFAQYDLAPIGIAEYAWKMYGPEFHHAELELPLSSDV